MSTYQTLYRKYRSQTFSDLVGQEAIVRALQGAIATDRIAHAYLFSGSRGTGKTSTARLLAKAVNCLSRQTGSSEPCNECESCRQIVAGAALDLIEIDAASNRGIDEIRDLREKVNLAPALGRRKVYIIDEAHMLTAEAFNALLKTLEEPPEHVVFVLCTTEAQKVPLTVLGRCQQFVFRRFTDEQVVKRLGWIASRESIAVEPGVLEMVARVAQGSMRDAVGLFDQLVPLAGGGMVTVESARSLLGIADPAEVEALVDAVLGGRAGEALDRLSAIYEGGGELRQVVRGVMERCRDLLVAAIDSGDGAARARLSGVLEALLHLDGEVRRHAEPRFLVEATLVRLASEAGAPAPPALRATSEEISPPAVEEAPPALRATSPPSGEEPRGEVVSTPEPVAPARNDLSEGWRGVLDRLDVRDRAYLREARPEVEGSVLVLWFPYSFHQQKARENAARIEAVVGEWMGAGTRVDFRLVEAAAPAAGEAPARPLAPEEHEIVQRAVRQLEGRVTKVSVPKETRP